MKKILLSIGGFDPTAGAGVCLDLKVYHHLGFIGTAILTAVTVQNMQQVVRIHCLPPELIRDQYRTLTQDMSLSGIKISMFGCQENEPPVRSILLETNTIPVVVDPLFKASSGAVLTPIDTLIEFLSQTKAKSTIVTPNCEEASALSGKSILTMKDMKQVAQELSERFQVPFLIKGFYDKSFVVDVLGNEKEFHVFRNKKIPKQVHGTGCFLSSSLLGFLVQGKALKEACQSAIQQTQKAMKKAAPCGEGQEIIILP
jgi:hydroxymethylpyrimidine/phosphomethylpyrimidine kinase